MRAAPPLTLDIEAYGIWRTVVWLLVASACLVLLAWWWQQPGPSPRWASGVALFGCAVALACSAGFWRLRPAVLCWDRQRWRLSLDGAAEQAGELAVAIDLGFWMLLSFVPQGVPGHFAAWRCRRWVAVQRRGLESTWHALRCTVYARVPAGRFAP